MSTFSQLLAQIGDDKIKIQRLLDCLKESKTNKKGVTTVTFQTETIHTNELMFGGEGSTHTGLIVWIPTAAIDPAREALKNAKPSLNESDIVALIKAAGTFADQSVGDYCYNIRETELLGWEGPKVVAWGEAASTITRLRGEGKI